MTRVSLAVAGHTTSGAATWGFGVERLGGGVPEGRDVEPQRRAQEAAGAVVVEDADAAHLRRRPGVADTHVARGPSRPGNITGTSFLQRPLLDREVSHLGHDPLPFGRQDPVDEG